MTIHLLHPDYLILFNTTKEELESIRLRYRPHSQDDAHTYCMILSRIHKPNQSCCPLPPAKAKWTIIGEARFLAVYILDISIAINFVGSSCKNILNTFPSSGLDIYNFLIVYDTYQNLEQKLPPLQNWEYIKSQYDIEELLECNFLQACNNPYKEIELYILETMYLQDQPDSELKPNHLFLFKVRLSDNQIINHLQRSYEKVMRT